MGQPSSLQMNRRRLLKQLAAPLAGSITEVMTGPLFGAAEEIGPATERDSALAE